MRDVDVAWAAGLFDGEGSIGVYVDPRPYRCVLRLAMTDATTVLRFHEVVGAGRIDCRPARERRLPHYSWCCGGRQAVSSVLSLIRPYLVTKSYDADLAIMYAMQWPPTESIQESIRVRLGERKTKGRSITTRKGKRQ